MLEESGRAGLIRYKAAIHLTVEALGPVDERSGDDFVRRELDLLARRNLVLTVHDGPVDALERFQEQFQGDTLIGQLDAGSFLEALVDNVLTTYFARIEEIEEEIDDLDEVALRGPDSQAFLVQVIRLRRRVAILRRTIAPHRDAFAPLARADVALDEALGHPLPHLATRLEQVIEAVENARQLLVGAFDIYLGRAAHRSNEVMKVLTILSAVLLPAVVLAGIMGMNFQMPFFQDTNNFWFVIGGMFLFAGTILVTARLRRWI